MPQEFGGIWTIKKLAVLQDYLKFYTTALKGKFTLHYADAFAGSGEFSPAKNSDQDTLIPHENMIGSVETALSIDPAFDQYHFNDIDPVFIKELERIKSEHPDKQIEIHKGDANTFVPDFCSRMKSNDRVVLMLDPFSTQLDWATLKPVTDSGVVDLWLLFPISAILRMTPKDGSKIKPEWKQTLDRLLGTNDWEQALYKPVTNKTLDLFDNTHYSAESRINVEEPKNWISKRLQEEFRFVAEPVLLNNNNRPLFLFYFAVSNPTKSAWGLAQRVTSQIINKYNSG